MQRFNLRNNENNKFQHFVMTLLYFQLIKDAVIKIS
jgi:hypothetical protein